MKYLESLHEKHDQWLNPDQAKAHNDFSFTCAPMTAGDSGDSQQPQVPKVIADKVYLLDERCPTAIQNVPTLILDCDQNINFSVDVDAVRQYAEDVATFFEYIKAKRKHDEQQKIKVPPKVLYTATADGSVYHSRSVNL